MNFSTEWDERYRGLSRFSVWPWSDLVGYVMRYARPTGPHFKVLELGCAAGANVPFFLSLGVDYYGIEGSPTVVEQLLERFPTLKEKICAGDFTENIPFLGEFDLIVDRSSLTHNSETAIKACLDKVHSKLRQGGKFIGIDWFSTAHSEFSKGVAAEDTFTRTDYQDGAFAGVGRVHFSDKTHLHELFDNFDISVLEHKTVRREIPDGDWHFASWNFVAEKV
jgi:phospholipid N-methyltransferase